MTTWPSLSGKFKAHNEYVVTPTSDSDETETLGSHLQNGLKVSDNPYMSLAERGISSIIGITDANGETVGSSNIRVKGGKIYPGFVRGFRNEEITAGPVFDAVQEYCEAVNDRKIELNVTPSGDVFENKRAVTNEVTALNDVSSLWSKIAKEDPGIGSIRLMAVWVERTVDGPKPETDLSDDVVQFKPRERTDLDASWAKVSTDYKTSNGYLATPVADEKTLYAIAQTLEVGAMDRHMRGHVVNHCTQGNIVPVALIGNDGVECIGYANAEDGQLALGSVTSFFEQSPSMEQVTALREFVKTFNEAEIGVENENGFKRLVGMNRFGRLDLPTAQYEDGSIDVSFMVPKSQRTDGYGEANLDFAGLDGYDEDGNELEDDESDWDDNMENEDRETAIEAIIEKADILPIPGFTDGAEFGSWVIGRKPLENGSIETVEDFVAVAETFIDMELKEISMDTKNDIPVSRDMMADMGIVNGQLYPLWLTAPNGDDVPLILAPKDNGSLGNILEGHYTSELIGEYAEKMLPLIKIGLEGANIDLNNENSFKQFVRSELTKNEQSVTYEKIPNFELEFNGIHIQPGSGAFTLRAIQELLEREGAGVTNGEAKALAQTVIEEGYYPVIIDNGAHTVTSFVKVGYDDDDNPQIEALEGDFTQAILRKKGIQIINLAVDDLDETLISSSINPKKDRFLKSPEQDRLNFYP